MEEQHQYNYPFSLISSTGLGTAYSSLGKIGSLLPLEGFGGAKLLFYPNINTGNLVLEDHLLPIEELGGKIKFGFTYNSQAGDANPLWQFSHKQFLQLSPTAKTAILREPDGHLTSYIYDQTGFYFAPAGSKDGTAWLHFDELKQEWRRYQPGTHTTEIYNTQGLLLKQIDEAGRSIQYKYDAKLQLSAVTSQSGSRYEIRRQGKAIHIYLLGGDLKEQLLKTYQFDDQGRLAFSQTPSGYKTEYQYGILDDAWRLDQVKQSDQTLLKFGYDDQKRVSTFNLGTKSVFKLQYRDDTHAQVELKDAYSGMTTIGLDNNADILEVTRSTGYNSLGKVKDTTSYTYNTQHQLTSITHPSSGKETFNYTDVFGLVQFHHEPNGQTTEKVYQEDADKVRLIGEIRYGENNTPLVTRYVYDPDYKGKNVFLRFKISPEGRVTEYRPDENGNMASRREYLGGVIDLSHRDPHTSPSLGEMKEWLATQNPQQVSLTNYYYTPRGQLTLTRSYSNIDKEGNGIKDGQMGEIFTYPNLYGNWFTTQIKQNNDNEKNVAITQRTFDDLQRLTSETNALNQTTTYQYLDAKGQLQITYPNGLAETYQKDDRGKISQLQAVVDQARETQYRRDTNGRLGIMTRPDGQFVYFLYDHQDRLGYEITTSGIVTEYNYDLQHRYQSKTRYASCIDPKQLFFKYPPPPGFFPIVGKLIKLLEGIADPNKDQTSYQFYDDSGRLSYSVDADNYVSEYRYDPLDRKTLEIAYSRPLLNDQLAQLTAGQAISLARDFTQDRATRYFYDNDGSMIGQQDSGGYVTEYVRGHAQEMKEKIQYATKVPIDLTIKNFQQVRPKLSPQDAHYFYFYNARLRQIAQLSPASQAGEYYFTAHFYYPNGLKQKSVQYHAKVTQVSPNPPSPEPGDRATQYYYDLLDRLLETVLPNQKSELRKYDVASNLIFEQSRDLQHLGNTEPDYQRTTTTRYDGWNQAIQEINVFGGEITHRYQAVTGLKTQSTDALNRTTYYFYDIDKRLVAEVDPLGGITETVWDTFGDIIQTIHYANRIPKGKISEGGYLTPEIRKLFVSDPNQDQATSYTRNKRRLVVQKKDAKGNPSTYEYNAFRQRTQEKLPVGSSSPTLTQEHEFDVRGPEILTRMSALDTATETIVRHYDHFLGRETYRMDGRNGIYLMAYDSRGLLSQLTKEDGNSQASHQTTYNAFDEIATETDSLGKITTHRYDVVKRTHNIDYPVQGVKDTITQNIFGETIQKTDSLGHTQTWTHAPHGEIKVYQNPLQQTLDQQFDVMGQLKSKKDANQIETSLDYDDGGRLATEILDATGLKLLTTYQRDSFGNAVIAANPRKVVTKNTFDQANLLTESVHDAENNGLNLKVTNTYNAQGTVTSKKQGNTLKPDATQENYQIDGRSRSTGKTIDPNGLQLRLEERLNSTGDVIAEIDFNTNITRKFYDTLGRLRFIVDPEGGVAETAYDTEDRIHYTRLYEKGIDPKELNDQTDLKTLLSLVKTDPQDTLLYYFYDASGKERFQVNSLGVVGERQYDLAEHEIKIIKYDAKIDTTLLPTLTTDQLVALMAPEAKNPKNRVTYFILDAKGQTRFVIGCENFISEKRYDANGNTIAKISYAVQLMDPETIAKLPPEQVLQNIKLDPLHDRASYGVFDSRNNLEFKVDGEGCVSQFWRDENNNLIQTCQYQTKINVPANYLDLVSLLRKLVPTNLDRITYATFDRADRLTSEKDPLSCIDTYTKDVLGNTIVHKDRAGNDWLYEQDKANRLVLETTPVVAVTFIQKNTANNNVRLTYTQKDMPIENKKVLDNNGNELSIIKAFNSDEPRTLACTYNKRNQLIQTRVSNVLVSDETKPASFDHPPVKTIDVTTQIVYNAKKLKVCEQNEAGYFSFYVHDSEGNVVYEIDCLGAVKQYLYNSFNEIVAEDQFAAQINLDLSQYTKTGVPLSVMLQPGVIVPNPEDRIKIYVRDNRGDIILTQQGPTFYYLPNGTDHPICQSGYSQIKQHYNAFGECYYKGVLINPQQNTWTQQLYWFDRRGKTLAECDPEYRVVRRTWDAFQNEIRKVEWANQPKQFPTPVTSLADLDGNHNPSPQDRTYVFDYDLASQCIQKTTKQVVIQRITFDASNSPSLQDAPAQDLTQKYQYDPLRKRIAITFEDGTTAYTYYNKLSLSVATTDCARQTPTGTTLIPLSYFGNNAFGQPVMIERFKQGTREARVDRLPVPIAPDPGDQLELTFFDNRGLAAYTQNAEGAVQGLTYNEIRKVKLHYYRLTNTINNALVHIDAKSMIYDAMNRTTSVTLWRDNQRVQITAFQYNNFGNCIAEGPGDHTWPLYRRFDALSNCWSDNENGTSKITLKNLAGQITVLLHSPTKALSSIPYDQLATLLTWRAADLEREETQRDRLGRKFGKTEPAYSAPDTSHPANIPLSIATGRGYPDFGPISLTWVKVQETTVVPKFLIWPLGHPTQKQELTIKSLKDRSGVDVSSLETDLYDYQINYYFVNPITLLPDKTPMYQTEGKVQFDTGNATKSYHVVVSVENNNKVTLTGNTIDVTAIELWQNNQKIAQVPVQFVDGKAQADLSAYASGVYILVPVAQSRPNLPRSLPFTIYTNQPANTPFSKEIQSRFSLAFLEQNGHHGQLIWEVPSDYEKKPVFMICKYSDQEDQIQIHEDTILPGTDKGHYTDSEGNTLICNTEFEFQVKQVIEFFLLIQLNDVDKLAITAYAKPSTTTGDGITVILTNSFPSTTVLYIAPLTGFIQLPTLSYLDMTLDRLADWKQLPALGMTREGIVVDVSSFEPCIYPFKIADQLSFVPLSQTIQHHFQGIIPGQTLPTTFMEAIPLSLPGQEQNFKLLFSDRETVSKRLLEYGEDESVRKQLAPEILQALIGASMVAPDDEWRLLTEKYQEAYHTLNALVQRKLTLSINDDEQKLAQEKAKQQLATIQIQLLNYCTKPPIFESYINALKEGAILGYLSALLYAKASHLTLYLWEKDPEQPYHFKLIDFHADESSQPTLHLSVSGYTHFHVLLPEGVALEQVYGVEPNYHFAVTRGSSIYSG